MTIQEIEMMRNHCAEMYDRWLREVKSGRSDTAYHQHRLYLDMLEVYNEMLAEWRNRNE